MLYTEQFLSKELAKILEESQLKNGARILQDCQQYIIKILADKLDKNPWQPHPSYAEAYMTVSSVTSLLELAETCWYTRAVFPELGARRGLNPSYYVQLGQGCYNRVLTKISNNTLEQMCQHFEFLAEVTLAAIRNQQPLLIKLN